MLELPEKYEPPLSEKLKRWCGMSPNAMRSDHDELALAFQALTAQERVFVAQYMMILEMKLRGIEKPLTKES